jgi:hypothetical protein
MDGLLYIEQIPLWILYAVSVVIVMASIGTGVFIARRFRKLAEAEQGESTGSVVAATLGLLAFMLAFTFDVAVNRRDVKRDLLLEEVNAIGTTYLRADLIPEPGRSDVRKLLQRYIDIRIELPAHPEKFHTYIEEAKQIQNRLWAHAVALREADLKNPDIAALFIEALNQTIDLQTKRITVLFYKIPGMIWVVLAALTVFAMASVGYQIGQKGRFNWVINLALAMSFSGVIVLIADLDRVTSGWLRISNQPMVELRADMNPP